MKATLFFTFVTFAAAGPYQRRTECPSSSCNVQGWEVTSGAGRPYWLSWNWETHSRDACGARCDRDPICQSFSVGDGSCRLYKQVVSSCASKSVWGPRKFSNKCCVASQKPTTTSTVLPTPSICGSTGYDRESPRAFLLDRSARGSAAACANLCKKTKTCASYAFSSQICLLYSASLRGNFHVDRNSPYKFYDTACVVGGTTSTSTRTTNRISSHSQWSMSSSYPIISGRTSSYGIGSSSLRTNTASSTAASHSTIPDARSAQSTSTVSTSAVTTQPLVSSNSVVSLPSMASDSSAFLSGLSSSVPGTSSSIIELSSTLASSDMSTPTSAAMTGVSSSSILDLISASSTLGSVSSAVPSASIMPTSSQIDLTSSVASQTLTTSSQTVSFTPSISILSRSSDSASGIISSSSGISLESSKIGSQISTASSALVITASSPTSIEGELSTSALSVSTITSIASSLSESTGPSSSQASSSESSSTPISSSQISMDSSTSLDVTTIASSSNLVSSSSSCIANPTPRPTCNRNRDCPSSTNLVMSPTAPYPRVPMSRATGAPYRNISVPINSLTPGSEYVLTFYGVGDSILGAQAHSCCNLTAFINDVIVSQYCVGYYWTFSYSSNGPYAGNQFRSPRSPAVVYRASEPDPTLRFNVLCPTSNNGAVTVADPSLYSVTLVPRCNCVEEDKFQSLQTQPSNLAWNGNFADFDYDQENPISGWTSQESWKNQVVPVQYAGKAPAEDKSNTGAVVLHGTTSAIYRTIKNLVPGAPYNVSLLWQDNFNTYDSCNLVVQFDGDTIMDIRRIYVGSTPSMNRSSTVIYPRSTSGVLWIGSRCTREFIFDQKVNIYATIRIDDVSFTGITSTTNATLPICDL